MKEFIISRNDADQRVDKFLTKSVPKLPKNLLYKYIRLKRVKVNGKRCEISTRLNAGDVMQLYINDEFFEDASDKTVFLSAPASINILYEDENIILCDKKSGLVVHEDESGSADTLINRVTHYLYDKGEYNPDKENSFAPALCNRIDRNTGGIVICAKNAESLRILNQKIKDRELHKKYLCVTVGIPPKQEDTLTAYHQKNEQTKTVRVSAVQFPGSKTMITKYRALKCDREKKLALLEVDLITGRTHQIRAHLAYEGYPLLGDGKYGINKINREYNVKTQALYSYKLEFDFVTDSGCLEYLNGKKFEAENVWFTKLFEK
ncbi:RluA family pseudouridine synthase [Ruminococcus sp. Marseille-P6503]|uniref:RluA family pseudouridine synthase n=1 Tax=Ruminococcus sp. Marseille-P6503 TaxID=2364796 RepID=UPI000F544B43|nr:RluA family pseudouridine synthase [Ruminococcus sp. Marseille-P6503]